MAQLKRNDFIGVADMAGDQEIGPNWSGMVPQGLKRAVAGIGEYGARVAAMPVYAAKDVANKGANAVLGIGDSIVGATTGRRFNPPQFDTGSTARNIAAMGQLQGEAMDALGAQPVAAAATPTAQPAVRPIGSMTQPTTTPTAAPNPAPPIASAPTARAVSANTATNVPSIGATGPSAIVKGDLDPTAATALHNRVDFSPGSQNSQNIAADARYKDEVAKAVKANAIFGNAPDASQIREIGMSNADVTNLLAANNRNGQFTNTIASRLAQQKTDADTVKSIADANESNVKAGLAPKLADSTINLQGAQAKDALSQSKLREAQSTPEWQRASRAKTIADEAAKESKDLTKTFYNSIKDLSLPAGFEGRHMEIAKDLAAAEDPANDFGIYYTPGQNRQGIAAKRSIYEPLLKKYLAAGYPEANAYAAATADLQNLEKAHNVKLSKPFPNLDRLLKNSRKPVDDLGVM